MLSAAVGLIIRSIARFLCDSWTSCITSLQLTAINIVMNHYESVFLSAVQQCQSTIIGKPIRKALQMQSSRRHSGLLKYTVDLCLLDVYVYTSGADQSHAHRSITYRNTQARDRCTDELTELEAAACGSTCSEWRWIGDCIVLAVLVLS